MSRSRLLCIAIVSAALFGGTLMVPAQAQGLFDQLKKKIPSTLPGVSDAISGTTSGGAAAALSLGDITAGLKEALKVGAERVIQTTGKADGYNGDPAIHIPLPPQLQNVQSTLRRFGLSGMADDLELKLNRAAEAAAPKTKELIVNAISGMTLEDAKAIYNGPADAATQYFKRTTSGDLKGVIKPVVDQTLNSVGAVASYDQLMGKYSNLPFVPDVKANISDHTVGLALQGLFHYLAKEEAAIRQNPAKRTTELLTKVFGR
jgi:hypothetical protein